MAMNASDRRRPISIRPALADDYPAIVLVWRAAGLKPDLTARDSERAFLSQLARFASSYLVATEGDRIVGVVLGSHDERKGWINRLAVTPECQRRGIATALARECETALRAAGMPILAALVEPENAASRRVFEKLGYATDVEVTYFRKLGRPGLERD